MKLHGSYTSPFARHCRIALAQENIAFEFVDTDFKQSMVASPTGKVPYLEDGDLFLTDSLSILKHVREKAGKTFFSDTQDLELFTIANTLLDTNINLLLLDMMGGIKPDQTAYLRRQGERIQVGIEKLNKMIDPTKDITVDGQLRCACYVDFTAGNNLVDFSGLDNLQALRSHANQHSVFADTAPPAKK